MARGFSLSLQYLKSQIRSASRFIATLEEAKRKDFELLEDVQKSLDVFKDQQATLRAGSDFHKLIIKNRKYSRKTRVIEGGRLRRYLAFLQERLAKAKDGKDDEALAKFASYEMILKDLILYVYRPVMYLPYRALFREHLVELHNWECQVTLKPEVLRDIETAKIIARLSALSDVSDEERKLVPDDVQQYIESQRLNTAILSRLEKKQPEHRDPASTAPADSNYKVFKPITANDVKIDLDDFFESDNDENMREDS